MIKLLAIDLTGTLLDNNFKLSDLNRKALIDAHKKGIEIVLTTGKLIYSVLPIINLVGTKSPQITCFGATIITSDLKILNSVKIKPEDYLKAVSFIKEKGYNPMVTLEDNKIYYDNKDPYIELMKKSGEKIVEVDSIETEGFSKNVVSLSVMTGGDDLLDEHLTRNFPDKFQILKPAENFISVLDSGVSKGRAVADVAKLLDIKEEEIAVFGDSTSDISMFEVSGVKIAVENADPELIKRADIITDSNHNSGVGKAIYEHILN